MHNLLNWSEISTHFGFSRNTIRQHEIRKKHVKRLDKLFLVDLPEWWRKRKEQIEKNNR